MVLFLHCRGMAKTCSMSVHVLWFERRGDTLNCDLNCEEQGDTNSVDDFNRQLCVVCEVEVTNTDVYLCAWMYGSTILAKTNSRILFTCKQGESADKLQLFTQILVP